MKSIFSITTLCFVALVFTPVIIFAQGIPGGGLSQGPTISLSNDNPQPFTEITATLQNYGGQNIPEPIIWRVNGNRLNEFDNSNTATITVGDITSNTNVEVRHGDRIIATKTIQPVYIDIIAVPQTYVPPGFAERAVPISGSKVQLLALVEERNPRAAHQYNYEWRTQSRQLGQGVVRGNNLIEFTAPNSGGGQTITVNVTRDGFGKVGSRTIFIPTTQPRIYLYSVNTLFGTSPIALEATSRITADNIAIEAIPYYITTDTISQSNNTRWMVDGQPTSDSDDPFFITLQTRGGSGSSLVRFSITDTITNRTIDRSVRLSY